MVKRLIDAVLSNGWADIARCYNNNNNKTFHFFWCGNDSLPYTEECQIDAQFGSIVAWTRGPLLTLLPPPTASGSTHILTTVSPIALAGSVASSRPSEPTDDIFTSTTESSPTITTAAGSFITSTTESSPTTMTTMATVTVRTTSVIYQNQTGTVNTNSTTSRAVGAGLGVPLGLALFAGVGYLLLRNRSRKNAAPSPLPQPSMDNRARFTTSRSGPHELIGDVNDLGLLHHHQAFAPQPQSSANNWYSPTVDSIRVPRATVASQINKP